MKATMAWRCHTRSNSEFLADLNAEFHDRALLANQKRYYKRSRRVGLAKKPIDKTKETYFACVKLGHFQKDYPSTKKSTPSYPFSNKSFMAIAEEEPSVEKNDARSGQWVEITIKKVQRLISMTDGDERKYVLDYAYVDLYYVEDQRKNLLNKFNSLNLELSSYKISDLKKVIKNGPQAKSLLTNCSLSKFLPRDSSKDNISLADLTLTETICDEIKNIFDKRSAVKALKKKAQLATSTIPNLSPDKKADSSTEKLLLTLIEEVKGLKEQIKIPSDTSLSVSQSRSSKSAKSKQKT
ncbi:hypothetical protein Tco_1334377 [Tanacetum coccineum]